MINIRYVLPFVLLGVCKSEFVGQFNQYRIIDATVPHTTSIMMTTVAGCDRYYYTKKSTRAIAYDATLQQCYLYEENAFPLVILPAPSTPRTVYVKGTAYVFVQSLMTWIDAKHNCEVNGGQLVKIESAEENELLVSWLPLHGSNNNSPTDSSLFTCYGPWIGLNDRSDEGMFSWADGSSLGDFSNWVPNNPSNTGDDEDCVDYHPQLHRWNDVPCSKELWSICEYN